MEPALVAATHAEGTGANDAARFLRVALDLLPEADPRRPRLLGRLGLALAWALRFDEAVAVAEEAASVIAGTEGADEAVGYLAQTAFTCAQAGGQVQAWALAARGLGYPTTRRTPGWALLVSFDDERHAAEDPDVPGVPGLTPERLESARLLKDAALDPLAPAGMMAATFPTRSAVLGSTNISLRITNAGEITTALADLEIETRASLERGQLFRAARCRDFRTPGADGRHGLARICALTGRHEEAGQWFAEARRVLGEQGALPVLAICDLDEAVMFTRRGTPGDAELARPLLARARDQFESLAMTGWLRRADELLGGLSDFPGFAVP